MRNPEILLDIEQTREKKSKKEILNLSPEALVQYLSDLEERGKLENFLQQAVEDDSLLAELSYWEKWLKKDQQAILDKIIKNKRENYPGNSESLPLELEKKFTEKELKLIFSNLRAIQLTFGCSKGCPFCGFDAIKGVRESIPYPQLANLFEKYGSEISKGEPMLYWASEPSDYESKDGLEDRTYKDVHQLAIRHSGYDPSITSSNTSDKDWMNFMASSTSEFSVDRRLSVFGMREDALDALKTRLQETKHMIRGLGNLSSSVRPHGEQFSHIKGMGESLLGQKESDDILKAGIACTEGTLLTPRGLYSTLVMPITKENPQGLIITPLERISDEAVKKGDNIQEVMCRSVIEGRYYFKGGGVKKGDKFQKYTGSFPKSIIVNTSGTRYKVSIDQEGMIVESEELDESDKTIMKLY
ncbi:MAG: hypothetical protein A3H70_05655 [Candidatus Komeilibacteria bacterium RIFCSPLOWO2_02_FULL_48_11]|uniref:Radical SAM core domain-containing protein n=1 Tax=Candidatus Komeilibacteria bacterium RIFCSPLOWO2_02_FULL_48_11 TaxID=1798553 RepID=A0A1G2BW12_9BACT|nr:MAG: hypothetical protein A3H70_05655 [Candidatus Komeilibacteria bacterium RIFCSPLOWO2_02_FULL_48_11]